MMVSAYLCGIMLMMMAHLTFCDDTQYIHCSHACPNTIPTQCKVKDMTGIYPISNSDGENTESPPPAPSSCSLEVVQIAEVGRKYKSAFARTNFTIPRMRKEVKMEKFIFYTSNGGIETLTYSLTLPRDAEYWKHDIRVTVDLCNIRITGLQFYYIDILPLPFRKDTTESQQCGAVMDFEMTDCCSFPLRGTYPCSGMDCPAIEGYSGATALSAPINPELVTEALHEVTEKISTTTTQKLTSKTNPYNILVIPATICLVLLTIAGITWIISKCRQPTKHRLMILVSTGDQDSKYRDISNEIASEMKESGKFEHVYFSDWSSQSGDKDIEELREAISNCTVALLISSPFGVKSYQDFLERKTASTWKDLFVLGSYAIYNQSSITLKMQRRIIVAYIDEESKRSSHLHSDFVSSKGKFYNLSNQIELNSLCASLLGGKNCIKSTSKMIYRKANSCEVKLVV